MRKLYLLGIVFLLASRVFGQTAASYSFSTASASFSSIVGASGTSSTTAISGDDLTLNSISIGFNFVFACNTYTTLSACSNGWLSLANTTDNGWVNDNTVIASYAFPTPSRGFLMGFWDDLRGNGHTAYYRTSGTAPNRVFTFEWNNFHTYAASGNATFQIKLYETTNVIEYHYGSTSYSGMTATIGIANSASDYITLNNRSASPTPSSSTFYMTSITVSPAANQIYRFTPTGNLVVAPSSSSPVCSGNTLSLNGNITSGTATSYSWSGPGGYSSTSQNPTRTSATTSMSGIYTFTATNACGAVSDTTSVRVDSTPTATISGTTSFCSGGSDTITFTGTAGATVSYTINGGSALSVVIGAGGTANVLTGALTATGTSTTYTYALSTATLGSCTGTLTGSAVVTVNPNPSTITGPSAVCLGQNITLNDADAGGSWASSSTAIASISPSGTSCIVNGTSAGTATITYSFATGCYDTAMVTVNSLPSAITGASSVCEGSSITLSSSTTGGSWASSNTSIASIGATTGILYGVSAGLDTVTYTLPTGCSITTVVTVNPQPSAITGLTAVCAGSAITLSVTPTGGTWSSSNSSVATISTTGTVNGVTAGGATISYALTGGCYSTASITVNPLPAVFTGARSVCFGSATTLSTTSTGGSWSSSNTSIATVSTTGSVFGAGVGLVNITYTLPTGCYVTDTFRVNAVPGTITGPSTVCVGATISVTSSPSGGTWSSSNASIASINVAGTIMGVAGGSATITYTTGTGCYTTASITVNIAPAAITGPSAVCAGSTITLSSTTSGGSWSSSNTAVATVNASGVVLGLTAGSSVISYTNTSGCFVTQAITVNPLPVIVSGPDSVCLGSTTFYTASGGAGTWTNTGTSITYVASSGGVDAIATGNDTLIYTLTATGCATSKPVTVKNIPAPITGPSSVCEGGSTITLSDTSSSCTWSSSNTAIASVDGAGMVTGVSAGTVTISYTSSITYCSAIATITVQPLPSVIGGPSAVCQSSSITLTNTLAGGSWSSSNTAIATISTAGVVYGVAVGSVTITYTSSAGCIATATVTVNGLPGTITGATAICEGLSITLANSVSGGTWSSSNASIATVDAAGTVTGVSAGVVTITYSLGSGCYATKLITVNALPALISGSSNVCHTYSVTYSDVTAGGTWSSSDGSIASISSGGVITGVSVGAAVITYTSAAGCIRTANISVDPLPAIISGTTNVCLGLTTALTDSVSGGTWTTSNASIASINPTTGIVTGTGVGTCNITYTIGSGCFVTASFTVNPLPAAITGPSSVCEFSTVTLGDVTVGGTWSSSNTAIATINPSSGAVTGSSAGTVTIYYTLPTTCNASISFAVVPTPAAITGPSQVCEAGGTITLATTTTGGTWTTASTGIASVNPTTGVVTGIAAGTATISYAVGFCYVTKTVAVIALPGATITPLGDTVICPGSFSILTSTTGSGYSYQWYNGASILSGETNSYYTATGAGSYRVYITNTYGCTSVSAPMSVSLSVPAATVTATGSTSFCFGGSVALNATSGSGLTYQWLNGGTAIAGATGVVYNATTAGNYSVVITNGSGCSSTSSAITVTIIAAPPGTVTVYGPLNFCSGDSVLFVADSALGVTYQWQLGGINITGATNRAYAALSPGSYRVFETNGAACATTSSAFTVNVFALPNATISASGPTTFCVGGSVLLSTPSVSGNTYQWLTGGMGITGATNNTYVANASGSIQVRVTSASGCVSTTTSPVMVTEVSVPVVIPVTSTSFCWGGSSILSVSVAASAGVSYQWQLAGVNIPGATAGTYNAGASGSYSCIVSVGGGACVIGSVAVSVMGIPLPNPVITYDGTRLKTGNFYTSYQWFRNYIPISGANSWFIIPTDTAKYAVQVSDTNGCRSISLEFPLHTIGKTGITEEQIKSIHIYPNPAENVLNIAADGKVRATLNTIDGRKLMDVENATQIDVTHLAAGTYLLLLYDDNGTMVKAERITKL